MDLHRAIWLGRGFWEWSRNNIWNGAKYLDADCRPLKGLVETTEIRQSLANQVFKLRGTYNFMNQPAMDNVRSPPGYPRLWEAKRISYAAQKQLSRRPGYRRVNYGRN